MISILKKTTITWSVAALALILILVAGCSSLHNPSNPNNSQNQEPATTSSQQNTDPSTPESPLSSPVDSDSADSDSIVYKNTQYGFSFTLPAGWKGYSIITGNWEGYDVESSRITESGPMISIRHPQWTSQNPRQDIPVMIFTINQWNLLQKETFHIGAAPMGPSELGRNDSYVFALPARYNYSFPTGYEEVEKILENHPLQVN
ncbi:MAG TPA: hypothetical protein DCZ10_06455 [Pelotomaculum sp.]|nr:hypothetical protein [Pelotomaculum sp.]